MPFTAPLSTTDFLKILHTTEAVSIWNRETGPVFWYAANVPGPFYVNTERVIGPELAQRLLKSITALLAEVTDKAERAKRIETLLLDAYEKDATYQAVIAALVETIRQGFPEGSYAAISGGERRDWLFSIPVAKLLNQPHAYLFKNRDLYSETPLDTSRPVLHVADLINNAASYFDAWFPILEANGLKCAGTACINTRGSNGLERLAAAGQKVVAVNRVDIGFFEESQKAGIIDAATLEELRVFFRSSEEWASLYLVRDETCLRLFDTGSLDEKSKARLHHFFVVDPWKLAAKHPAFFEKMKRVAEA